MGGDRTQLFMQQSSVWWKVGSSGQLLDPHLRSPAHSESESQSPSPSWQGLEDEQQEFAPVQGEPI